MCEVRLKVFVAIFLDLYIFSDTFFNMNSSIILHVHSLVDLITNSSSEVYLTATPKTVDAIKDILKLFLENANVATPVDELFDVKLVYLQWNDEVRDEVEVEGMSDTTPSSVRVTVKPGVTDFGGLVKVLNNLNRAFSAVELYN